jgi:hypothetical protein
MYTAYFLSLSALLHLCEGILGYVENLARYVRLQFLRSVITDSTLSMLRVTACAGSFTIEVAAGEIVLAFEAGLGIRFCVQPILSPPDFSTSRSSVTSVWNQLLLESVYVIGTVMFGMPRSRIKSKNALPNVPPNLASKNAG